MINTKGPPTYWSYGGAGNLTLSVSGNYSKFLAEITKVKVKEYS